MRTACTHTLTHTLTHTQITDLVVEVKQLLVFEIHKDIFLNLQREKEREREVR